MHGGDLWCQPRSAAATVEDVRRAERDYAKFTDEQLDKAVGEALTLPQLVALTAVLVSRVLGLDLFDVQLQAALALTDGKIVEMQTGKARRWRRCRPSRGSLAPGTAFMR